MWEPREAQKEILDLAMGHIQGVPYAVSARWLFYRLLYVVYFAKEDYKGKFLPLVARARKQFYNGWNPDTLMDDTRITYRGPTGYDSIEDFIDAVTNYISYESDKWWNQPYYIELWFEAKAMRGQFEYYTEEITLVPFGGDISIPAKSAAAKRLEAAYRKYNHPIKILYFGDDDKKGQTIPESALKDIRAWCGVDFDFIRCGLNEGDAEKYGIPDNPEKPGTYQWEALDDAQAQEIITNNVSEYFDKTAREVDQVKDEKYTEELRRRIEEALDNFSL